jgi:hypothetical protein
MKHPCPALVFVPVFIVGSLSDAAFGGSPSEIELLDGSKVYGEIVSIRDGTYTVNSPSIGTLTLDSSRIRLIRLRPDSAATGAASGSGSPAGPEIQALQKSLLSDASTMSLISALQNDPEVQELLKDPALLSALASSDVTALLANPSFLKLLNNPKIQEIQRKASAR